MFEPANLSPMLFDERPLPWTPCEAFVSFVTGEAY